MANIIYDQMLKVDNTTTRV